MTEELIVNIMSDAFFTAFIIVLPILGVSLIVGIIISIFQAATSIQEITLTFVPKILLTAVTIIFLFPWIMEKMTTITLRFFNLFSTAVK